MSMSFNTALSGLNASSTDLSVIGNNIANANTTGFKFSRTEFADLYSASLRTYSGARIGSGVKVVDVAQQFTQGNANTTSQSLDLAISGDGFFRVTDQNGLNPLYTRNGAFHIDQNNYIVNTQDQRLSAFQANSTGQVLGTLGDVYVDQSDIAPAPTTQLTTVMNLNALDVAPTATTAISVSGLRLNATDAIPADSTGTPLLFNPNDSATYNGKASTMTYDSSGTAHTANMFFVKTATDGVWDVHTVVDGVNGIQGGTEVFPEYTSASGTAPNTPAQMTFDPSTGKLVGTTPSQLTYNNDGTTNILGALNPITPLSGANPISFSINGLNTTVQTAGENVTTLQLDTTILAPATAIFNSTDPTSYTSTIDRPGMVIDSKGVPHDAHLYFVSKGAGTNKWDLHTFMDTVDSSGAVSGQQEVFFDPNNPAPVTVTANMNGTLNTQPAQFQYSFSNPGAGSDPIRFSINGLQSYADSNASLARNGNTGKIWQSPVPGELPDPKTYNYTTSTTIYDSQGSPHLAALYFIKTGANLWDVHTFVDKLELDGTTITSPNTQPNGGGSPVSLSFDDKGALLNTNPVPKVPLDLGKLPLTATMANGAASISFNMDLSKITQYGSPSGVSALSQDGFTTGHISSINVSLDGTVSSLFTNGKSRVLGQVAMVNFANIQGLRSVGNTQWAESSTSGSPLLGPAGSSNLGTIQSGALESSNVDLTKQLVDMIVSQRSFQANAQVISAVDTLTQTIVNLR